MQLHRTVRVELERRLSLPPANSLLRLNRKREAACTVLLYQTGHAEERVHSFRRAELAALPYLRPQCCAVGSFFVLLVL